MSGTKPAPYPADTRAKGWRFELDYEQIEQSSTWALAGPEGQAWALKLWLTAWRQVPCGSLPADEEVIASSLGMQPKQWQRHRRALMRGWWAADDGRLYHDTIAARVMEMMGRRRGDADRQAKRRAAKAAGQQADSDGVAHVSRVTPTGLGCESSTDHRPPNTEEERAPSAFPAREGATDGARAREGPGPEQPAAADAAVRAVVDAVRAAGYPDVSVGDPVLRSLVAQGLDPVEAADAATAGRKGGKGWGWVVNRITGRRSDAAALSLASAAPGQPWHATRSGIEAKGVELGLGRWDEQAAQLGRGEAFAAYEARVRSAVDGVRVAA